MSYQEDLTLHLTTYKESVLHIHVRGTFKGKPYPHILPRENLNENLFEEARGVLGISPAIKLHQYFHHLTSSQAFAFNLFFPYFREGQDSPIAGALLRALGCQGTFKKWMPEFVPNHKERTNIDVWWCTQEGEQTFCEVKLSETGFGKANIKDVELKELYSRRFEDIYSADLKDHLHHWPIDLAAFCEGYQFYRNLWHMVREPNSRLMFLLPEANVGLNAELCRLLNGVVPGTLARISIVKIESVISALSGDVQCPKQMREYADKLKRKYVISPRFLKNRLTHTSVET